MIAYAFNQSVPGNVQCVPQACLRCLQVFSTLNLTQAVSPSPKADKGVMLMLSCRFTAALADNRCVSIQNWLNTFFNTTKNGICPHKAIFDLPAGHVPTFCTTIPFKDS